MASIAETLTARPPGGALPLRPPVPGKNRAAASSAVVFFLSFAAFLPIGWPYGMNQINPINRLKPPSWKFPFGTDNLGRDMLSRCLYGAQLSVIIGFSAAGLATAISVIVGIVTGYLGGRFDMI